MVISKFYHPYSSNVWWSFQIEVLTSEASLAKVGALCRLTVQLVKVTIHTQHLSGKKPYLQLYLYLFL